MGLHITGDRCPACRKKGLVVGGFNPLTEEPPVFRPKGWIIDRLELNRAACPNCGLVLHVLAPRALKKLKESLRKDRQNESATYYPKSKRKKKKEE